MRTHVRQGLVVLFILLTTLCLAGESLAKVEATVQKTLKLEVPPVDAVTSADGRLIFVLTQGGEVLVYSARGELKETVLVDKSVDRIGVSANGDTLFLLSKAKKTFQILTLDFIQEINIQGSPFKGNPGAPVVIAVFSDFQ